jgi:sugar/nucleoside kinase (ribokinase family)
MSAKPTKKEVTVIGELHQDLFYQNQAFSDLATEIASDISANSTQFINQDKDANTKLRTLIINTMNRTAKKNPSQSFIKRGGNGNNSATLLAKIGVPTGLMTVVGSGSEWMLPEIEQLGISTRYIFKKDVPTPISTVIEDPEVTKMFIATNFKKEMNFEGISLPPTLFNDTLIAFITPIDFKYQNLLKTAVSKKVITAYTLELQKIEKYIDLQNLVTVMPEFMFCNLDDALKICQSEMKTPLESLEQLKISKKGIDEKEVEIDYQARKLKEVDVIFKRFARVRIYTLGKYGAWVVYGSATDERTIHQDVISIKVLNRTGAGDTFAAGFIAKLYENISSLEDYYKKTTDQKTWLFKVCLIYASAASALKISTGNAPSKTEIQEFLKKHTETPSK